MVLKIYDSSEIELNLL